MFVSCSGFFVSSGGGYVFLSLIVLKTFVRRFLVALARTLSNFQVDTHQCHLAWQEASTDSPVKNRSQHRTLCSQLLISHVTSSHSSCL